LRQGLAERLSATGDWWRELEGQWRLGRSKKDDYGCVEVELPEGGPVLLRSRHAAPDDYPQELKLWLLSDLLVRDRELRPEATLAAVCRALSEALPEAGAISGVLGRDGLIDVEARLRRHDGWQAAWGLPRPSLVSLQAGSCLRVTLERPVAAEALAALEANGLGERRPEGFGQIRFNDPLLQEKMKGRQPRHRSAADAPPPLQPLPPGSPEHAVAACIERAAWRAAIAERALAIGFDAERRKEVFGFTGDKPGPSQLGALRSRIARLTAPEPEDGPVRRWLAGVEQRRKDKWPARSLDRLRALAASQGEVWDKLGLDIKSLTADAQARLEKELWTEAIVALIGAAIRGQVLDLRAKETADA
jgi:CRISPR-associated protein Csx10